MQLGLIDLPWWGYVVVALALTHITIAAVTIFLHRSQAHRAVDLHPIVSHFFRFWLWLTSGMVTKEWVAIHRKHHAKCETVDDPHSPQTRGLKTVFWRGSELYRAEAKVVETLEKYGHGTPDDWMERNVYSRHSAKGIVLMMAINLALFGPIGLTIWAVQMAWIPVTAAGIINGIGHYWGYRNFACEDASTNVFPWGILIGGEELHNNHHAYGTSARLSNKWYEFDIGWLYIKLMTYVGLATVRKVAPTVKWQPPKPLCDLDSLQAIITHRYDVMTRFVKSVRAESAAEIAKLKANASLPQNWNLNSFRRCLHQEPAELAASDKAELDTLLGKSERLNTVYRMRQELAAIWGRSTATREQLLEQLQAWCKRAESSGIQSLQDFSVRLRCYA
ncbi:MAG: acyl-CoA desaturase [Sulfuriferula multivorans]|uniref:Acyl-CoA desaturase n=1 Tax=Sulfuriferula multivorans TaxID=1559896 RepID=A0A7C9P3B6_9PROT|nr:acyl-CoA desaturase [Sulfuriferula multivorans]